MLLERTLTKTQMSVVFEFLTFLTEFAVGAMVTFTVDVNHVGDGLSFAAHAFMVWVRRLRFHDYQLIVQFRRNKGLPLHIRVSKLWIRTGYL